ncbi:S-layer homology domain-containing protein [Paenibacillus sp. SYP-B3998]|nr:S-layer homology domain-containing protein [Paenibacillus sp. SYP-B3998]
MIYMLLFALIILPTLSNGDVVSGQVAGPKTPTGFDAVGGNQSVQLSWTGSDAAVGYHIYYTGAAQPVTVVGATYSYTITGLTNGMTYQFQMTAYDAAGTESSATVNKSVKLQSVIDMIPPMAPKGLKSQAGPNFVYLSWDAGAEDDLASYRVYVNGKLNKTVTSPAHAITVTSLTLGNTYTFEVSALDTAKNESAKSAAWQATPTHSLMISEVVPDTDNYASYDAFEYIELYNASEVPVDLKGYTIKSGSWSNVFSTSIIVQPWATQLLWTRRAEIAPLTLEGFNHYYLSAYKSKYLSPNQVAIMDNVGGLTNTGNQTVTLQDAYSNVISKAAYNGTTDISLGTSAVFSYPIDGSVNMRVKATKQAPTPGWLQVGQAPAKPIKNNQPPQTPTHVQAVPGDGFVTVSWLPNTENDLFGYNLYRNGVNVPEAFIPASSNEFTVNALTGNMAYTFQVAAVNTSNVESAWSPKVTAIPAHVKLGQQERVENPRNPAYQSLWDISKEGPVIPGLAEELVPQGVGYAPNEQWLLTDYYFTDGRPGVIAVTDARTGKFVKSVSLYQEDGSPYTGHAGGVSVSKSHVWISSEGYLYQMNLNDIVKAANGDQIKFANRVPVPVDSAFSTYDDGVLWVGEFYESVSYPTDVNHYTTTRDNKTNHAWIAGYVLDEAADTIKADKWDGDKEHKAVPDYLLSSPDKIQGIVVKKDTIYLSSSYGRNNNSLLYRYANPTSEAPHAQVQVGQASVPLWMLDGISQTSSNATLVAVPMTEGMTSIDNKLYVLVESGANKYRYTTTYVMDKILEINMDLWELLGTASIQDIPQVLKRDETVQASVKEARGYGIAIDRTPFYSFVSGNTDVVEVTQGGAITAKAVGETVITATYHSSSLHVPIRVVKRDTGGGNNNGSDGNGGNSNNSNNNNNSGNDHTGKGSGDNQSGNKHVIPLSTIEQATVNQTVQTYSQNASASLTQVAESFKFDAAAGAKQVDLPIMDSQPVGTPIGIYRIAAEGKLIYVGGTVKNGTLSAVLTEPGTYVGLAYNKTYEDLSAANFAYEAVRQLSAMQVVSGTDTNNYTPQQSVTRAEFVAMLARMLGLKAQRSTSFTDVKSDAWYASAVSGAEEAELTQGMSGSLFAPNETVSREQMAAFLLRAYALKMKQTTSSAAEASFVDISEVSQWAIKDLNTAYEIGLVSGREQSRFAPQERTTRAEAAKAIYQLHLVLPN